MVSLTYLLFLNLSWWVQEHDRLGEIAQRAYTDNAVWIWKEVILHFIIMMMIIIHLRGAYYNDNLDGKCFGPP
jgi:hypothetical protein